jgi:hypothetical protein
MRGRTVARSLWVIGLCLTCTGGLAHGEISVKEYRKLWAANQHGESTHGSLVVVTNNSSVLNPLDVCALQVHAGQ